MRKLLLVYFSLLTLLFSDATVAKSFADEKKEAPALRVASFTLINARKNRAIQGFRYIRNGAVIDLAQLPTRKLNVRANIRSQRARRRAASVQFTVNGESVLRNGRVPFALAGSRRRNYRTWTPEAGFYEMTATPFTGPSGSGSQGQAGTIKFTIIDGAQKDPLNAPTTTPSGSSSAGIPSLDRWKSNMIYYGNLHCNSSEIARLSTWEGNVWYYDGIRVYYQIADYTGDERWKECAQYVRGVYRPYVLNEGGKIGGWRVFSEGLAEDYRQTGQELSRQAALLLANNSAFAWAGGGASFELSRETAYIIQAYLTAEELGEARHPNLSQAVEYALGHLDQWAISRTASYVQPFMMGLTFEALIRYYQKHGDERIPKAIRQAADWLWGNMWDSQKRYFVYSDHTADLNMLIAPAYAWLWRQTGSDQYRQQADDIFAGGIEGAWLGGGKQFSQSYRWSFDYVKWRTAG